MSKALNSNNVIYGIHSVLEALKANTPILKIYILQNSNNKAVMKIKNTAKNKDIKIEYVDKNILDDICKTRSHQGIAANIKAYKYTDFKSFIASINHKNKSLIIVLDHITDAGNLGAIIRSAEAFGADAVLIPADRSASINSSTYKSSTGAINNIKIIKVKNLTRSIEDLKKCGYWVYGCSEHAKVNIYDEKLDAKTVLIFGSEDTGISNLVQKNCDFLVKLPLFGKTESLNVAQAATTCIYEWIRQMNAQNIR